MTAAIYPPDLPFLLIPLLSSLPTATISPRPPAALLPLLSPILRQRVQFLSSNSTTTVSRTEPWVHLLTYNSASASRLPYIIAAHSAAFEPHPVSGEIEFDYSSLKISYLRVDKETFHAYTTVSDLELVVKLTWCINDPVAGGDGWRISEVSILEGAEFRGHASIEEAESAFSSKSTNNRTQTKEWLDAADRAQMDALTGSGEESDDDYWASYDRTPGRATPAVTAKSPGPSGSRAISNGLSMTTMKEDPTAEAEYYARYATVQPAMERSDPDEEAAMKDLHSIQTRGITTDTTQGEHTPNPSPPSVGWETLEAPSATSSSFAPQRDLTSPLPASACIPESASRCSAHSGQSDAVAKLEGQAAEKEQCEVSVRRHIANTIKGLYFLAKGTGMERAEFDDVIKRELDCLGMFDEGEED